MIAKNFFYCTAIVMSVSKWWNGILLVFSLDTNFDTLQMCVQMCVHSVTSSIS